METQNKKPSTKKAKEVQPCQFDDFILSIHNDHDLVSLVNNHVLLEQNTDNVIENLIKKCDKTLISSKRDMDRLYKQIEKLIDDKVDEKLKKLNEVSN